MCLEHIRLSLPETNSLGQAYVCSFLQPICCTLCNYTGFFMASGNLQEKEFYLLKKLQIVLTYLKKNNHFNQFLATRQQKQLRLPYFSYNYISDDKRLLSQTFLGTFRPKLNSCNSNKFIISVCLCEGWTFIFFKGGKKISGRYLAVNGTSS